VTTTDQAWRRDELRKEMRGDLEQSIDARVDRYLEVAHQAADLPTLVSALRARDRQLGLAAEEERQVA